MLGYTPKIYELYIYRHYIIHIDYKVYENNYLMRNKKNLSNDNFLF